jgi:hypothetical protein
MSDLYALDEALDYLNGTNYCTVENVMEVCNLELANFNYLVESFDISCIMEEEESKEDTTKEKNIIAKLIGLFKKLVEKVVKLFKAAGKKIRELAGKIKNRGKKEKVNVEFKLYKLETNFPSGGVSNIAVGATAIPMKSDPIGLISKQIKKADHIIHDKNDNEDKMARAKSVLNIPTVKIVEDGFESFDDAAEAAKYIEDNMKIIDENASAIEAAGKEREQILKNTRGLNKELIMLVGKISSAYIKFLDGCISANAIMQNELNRGLSTLVGTDRVVDNKTNKVVANIPK